MGVTMRYATYLPPGFRRQEKLPLVVFLHGGGDSPDSFDAHGLSRMLDDAIATGQVPRAVIVIPEGDNGMWANWYDGTRHYEDWVILELMPIAEKRFGTQPCPAGCHLMGVSMGGSGATRFFLHHRDLFASVAIISAPIFNTRQMIDFANDPLFRIVIPFHRIFGPGKPLTLVEKDDPYLQLTNEGDLTGTKLFLAWGTNDRDMLRPLNEKFRIHLMEHEIPYAYEVFDGNHRWKSWNPVILRILKAQLDPTPYAHSPDS